MEYGRLTRANLIFSKLLPLRPVRFSRRFLVSANFSSCTVALAMAIKTAILKSTASYLDQQKFEWHAVRSGRFSLEVETVDEIAVRCIRLFFPHSLSDKSSVFIDADHGILASHLPEDLVVVHLKDSDSACFGLVWNLRLLDDTVDDIFNDAILGHQYIKDIL